MKQRFRDRRDAGRALAAKLERFRNREDVLVLGLPRGGVPVAYEVAKHLNAPLDVFLVRKLGAPGHEELAIGAIATGDVRVLNEDVVAGLAIDESTLERIAGKERDELRRREQSFRGERPVPEMRGRTVILVDDGLATGATMRAAAMGLRQQNPAQIIIAVPTASPETCAQFEDEVDEIVCAVTPEPFLGVGRWYEDFSQTTDEEVRQLLAEAAEENLLATPEP